MSSPRPSGAQKRLMKREEDKFTASLTASDESTKKSKLDVVPPSLPLKYSDDAPAKRNAPDANMTPNIGSPAKASRGKIREGVVGVAEENMKQEPADIVKKVSEDPSTDIPLQCLECCFGFDSVESSKAHFSEVHGRIFEPLQTPPPTANLLKYQGPNSMCYVKDCNMSFQTIREARAHLASAHPEKKFPESGLRGFSCPLCPKPFHKRKTLNLHIRRAHGQEAFEAYLTEAEKHRFKYAPPKHKNQLAQTLEGQESNPDPKCCIQGCDLSFPTIPQARKHLAAAHGLDPAFLSPCQTCGLLFTAEKKCIRHQLTAHSLHFNCTICGKKFKSRGGALTHTKDVHGQEAWESQLTEEEKRRLPNGNKQQNAGEPTKDNGPTADIPLECIECCFGFISVESARTHFLEAHGRAYESEQNPPVVEAEIEFPELNCSVQGCGLSFPTIADAQTHLIAAHPETPTLACPICCLLFAGRKNRSRHIVQAHTRGPSYFHCTLCGKEYNKRAGVLHHIRGVHGEEAVEAQLTEDEKRTLKYVRPAFLCFCGYKFKTQGALGVHEARAHRVPCSAEGCGLSFPSETKMGIHVRKSHSNSQGGGPDQVGPN